MVVSCHIFWKEVIALIFVLTRQQPRELQQDEFDPDAAATHCPRHCSFYWPVLKLTGTIVVIKLHLISLAVLNCFLHTFKPVMVVITANKC